MSDTYKTCSCGSEFTKEEFEYLGFVGLADVDKDGDKRLELRLCSSCDSTIGVVHAASLTSQKTGYICVHGRACQPGGITLCYECPHDPAKVLYRPVYKVTETSDQQIARVLADHSEPHEVQEKY
jgi:hypothetical protein